MVGIAFVAGGYKRQFLQFNSGSIGTSSDFLMLSIGALIIPRAFFIWGQASLAIQHDVALLSRAASVPMLLSYICFLIFAYLTHSVAFKPPPRRNLNDGRLMSKEARTALANIGTLLLGSLGYRGSDLLRSSSNVSERRDPKLSIAGLTLSLVIVTALLGFCTTFTGDSIDGLTQQTSVSQCFVGLILIPLLSCNAHAITLAKEDNMQQSFEITIASSLQLLLFILPLTVLIDWMKPHHEPPLTLKIDSLQAVGMFLSGFILKLVTAEGQAHW